MMSEIHMANVIPISTRLPRDRVRAQIILSRAALDLKQTANATRGAEGMLKEAYARESRECPECSCHNFTCSRSLNSCPNVFSLVLAWATTEATIQVHCAQ